jgi:hypothetical protein
MALRCGLFVLFVLIAASGSRVASAADENRFDGNDRWDTTSGLASIRPIEKINTDIRLLEEKKPQPQELSGSSLPYSRAAMNRLDWPELSFWWAPTDFSHWPLYFDDIPLERYGQTTCRLAQPVLSGVHFFGNVALQPYELLVDPLYSRITQLGHYRSGSDAPPVRERLRLVPSPAIWSLIRHH